MTLVALIRRFRWRVAGTGTLVLVEALVDLLFPLFIGIAINGLLDGSYGGVLALGGLGVGSLAIGSARRFFDTRAYTGMYEVVAGELVAEEQRKGTDTSTIAARTNLLTEFVEFLENSMPEIVTAVIGTFGILAIIAGLDIQVFLACLALFGVIVVTYWATGRRNYRLNRGYNDELERQVTAIDSHDDASIGRHFNLLMRWNRKLSDLETLNYIVVWLGVIALLVYAPIEVIVPGETEYGFAFAAILYVFQYIEAVATLPLYIQQLIRLQEISSRLGGDPEVTTEAA